MDGDKPDSTLPTFSYTDLYKYTGKSVGLSQHERRLKFLEEQKEKRHKLTDERRELSNLREQQVKNEGKTPKKKKSGFQFKLMLTEWLIDVPDDLDDMWLAKIAPEGFRVLLIAKQANTSCYSGGGRVITRLKTNFPGGSQELPVNETVLDCIFHSNTNTFFILDCLYWNSMSMLDSDVTFRFYWLKTQFSESPALARCGKYFFVLLDFFPAQRQLIQDIMFNQLEVEGHNYSYDGVVFYHKESHYTYGYTPLVAWLSSYMLPEKLQIDVPTENMLRKPKNYVSMEMYLEALSKQKKKNKTKNDDNSMDVL